MLGRFAKLEHLQHKHSAREAFEKLRDQGKIRYIGVTSHSSRVLADAIEDYPYDCALHYVLSHPVSTAIVGISAVPHLEENVRVARAFEPLGEKELVEIRAAARA